MVTADIFVTFFSLGKHLPNIFIHKPSVYQLYSLLYPYFRIKFLNISLPFYILLYSSTFLRPCCFPSPSLPSLLLSFSVCVLFLLLSRVIGHIPRDWTVCVVGIPSLQNISEHTTRNKHTLDDDTFIFYSRGIVHIHKQ